MRSIVTNALLGACSGVLVAGAVVGTACNTPIPAAAASLGYCILGAAGADIIDAISDPASLIGAITAACASQGAVTIEAIINTIEAYFAAKPDAAVGVSAVTTAQATIESRFHRVLSAALAREFGADAAGLKDGGFPAKIQ